MTTPQPHLYAAHLTWSGAAAGPTADYQSYSREFLVEIPGKAPLRGSSDPHFVGDPALHNPEGLLLASLSSCHLLSYLALCARAGIVVSAYHDQATATMSWAGDTFAFTEAVLHPRVTVAPGTDVDRAMALHARAHQLCFIARSVNFPVLHQATVLPA